MKKFITNAITTLIKIIASAQKIENDLYYCHSRSLKIASRAKRKYAVI